MLEETESQYNGAQSEFSMRKRLIPKHPKGFVNEWGALLQHQSEVQQLQEQEQHQKEQLKKMRFKSELDNQLYSVREKAAYMDREKYDFEQRKILEENDTKFKQQEQLKHLDEKHTTKRLMMENMEQLQYKRSLEKLQQDQEKQQFNNRLQHDQMFEKYTKDHEEMQKNRQKQELQEWYKDSTYRKQQVQQMIKEKERYDHENFINHTEQNHQKAVKEHLDTINKHSQIREFKNAVGFVPVDERQVQKQLAEQSMKKYYDQRQNEEERKNQLHNQQKNQEKTHMVDSYKYQMEKRKQDSQINKIEDRVYGSALKNSIETLNYMDHERKISQRYQTQEYADQLKKQMEDFKERELKKYNEMSERERMINNKPLAAYEAMQGDTNVLQIPGFTKSDDRDNFRRYNRKGIGSNTLLGQQGLLQGEMMTENQSIIGGDYKRGLSATYGASTAQGNYTQRDINVRQSLPIQNVLSRPSKDDMYNTLNGGNRDALNYQSVALPPTSYNKDKPILQQIQEQQQKYVPTQIQKQNIQPKVNSPPETQIQKPQQSIRRVESVSSLFQNDYQKKDENQLPSYRDRLSPDSTRFRANTGSMSSIFQQDQHKVEDEQERMKKLDEKRKQDLESRNKYFSSAAGVTSKLQNIEQSRYHEDSQEVKTNMRINTGLFSSEADQKPPTSEIKKIIPQSSLYQPTSNLDSTLPKDGSKTERPIQGSKTVNEMMDLLKLHKELDERVLGQMKADNIQEGRKNTFYGKEERVTPLQMSARQIIH